MKSIIPAVAAALAAAFMTEPQAQSYPSRPVRIIVPFSAGSQSDVLSRLIGPRLAEGWGQQVVVDNRPSAGGVVAGGMLANAPPDGHTLMLTSNAYAVSAALYTKLPFDPLKDITGVGQVASVPLVLVAAPSVGIKSIGDLIALAKQKPGQLTYGSSGTGSGTHMGGELLALAAGIKLVHVPYKGPPEALVDAVAARITFTIAPTGPALPLVKDGRLVALAVSTAQRLPVMKDVPTVAEAGLSGFDYDAWLGVLAPARTSRTILTQFNDAVTRIVNGSEIRERVQAQGMVVKPTSPEAFTRLVADDVAKLSKVAKASGIKLD
ncbi:MAG TPA: tripartite tricarboxylate transporter substrate binding protein [Burkholderiales bacterium]|nr:tripartite tricarboxylate transporter substrate binding protein [Burkholderiales bacterium]